MLSQRVLTSVPKASPVQWEGGWHRLLHFCSCREKSCGSCTSGPMPCGLISQAARTCHLWKSPFCSWRNSESHEAGQALTSHQINEDRGTGHWSIHCISYSLKVNQEGIGKPGVLWDPPALICQAICFLETPLFPSRGRGFNPCLVLSPGCPSPAAPVQWENSSVTSQSRRSGPAFLTRSSAQASKWRKSSPGKLRKRAANRLNV